MVSSAGSAICKTSIQQFLWDTVVTHASYMTCPSQYGTLNHGLHAADVAFVKDLIVGTFVKPFDPGDFTQGSLVELFQAFDVSLFEGPGFTTKQK